MQRSSGFTVRGKRCVAPTLLCTLILLLLTNVFWAVWGAMDIGHPSILGDTDRWIGSEVLGDSSAAIVVSRPRATRTTYEAGRNTPEFIAGLFPGTTVKAPIRAVAPGWLQRRFTDPASPLGTGSPGRGWFTSVGWPVRLLWCGLEAEEGQPRKPVPRSGIRVRERNRFKSLLDGIMPVRPILYGQAAYAAFWIGVVVLLPRIRRGIETWLVECGCTRAECKRSALQFVTCVVRGEWINLLTLSRLGLLLLAGLLVNLALAWACAAWVAPVGETSIARLTPVAEGVCEGESRLDRFGRSLIFRARTREWKYMPNGVLEYAMWDFDSYVHSEIQAGWPWRAWSCRRPGYMEMWAFTGGPMSVMPGPNPIVGGIELPPFTTPIAPRAWRALPYQPLWLGAVGNTIFFAGLIWLGVATPRMLRRMHRHRLGRCITCGYDLRGMDHAVCPECGSDVQASRAART